MATQQTKQYQSPDDWREWNDYLAAGLDARVRWMMPILLSGILFGRGRRTVTSWLRAAGIVADYEDYYYFVCSLGRKTEQVATRVFQLVLANISLPDRLLLVIDDTPTKRYGRSVEGADIHRNPTPGPAGQKFLYGHIWVSISLALRHPQWGSLALPLLAKLYVRRRSMGQFAGQRNWIFQTKLELAAGLLRWIAPLVKSAGKTFLVVVDGGYAKRSFLEPAMASASAVIGRLRRDAALFSPPPKKKAGERGRPRKYGRERIRLPARAARKRGWKTIPCTVYGRTVEKKFKTFLATWRPAGGLIRVVLIHEADGCLPLFCTDPHLGVKEIIEAFADRATIEQNYHDLKEVWGAGQQQVRNIWSNVAVFNLNVWMHTLVETWAWSRRREELGDRADSPWDDPDRRPSHADRRKALQRLLLREQFSSLRAACELPRKTLRLVERLICMAT
jgi:hypothetical protein